MSDPIRDPGATSEYIDSSQLRTIIPLSDTTIWRHVSAGRFPPHATSTGGKKLWRKADVDAWLGGKRTGWAPSHDPEAEQRHARAALARSAIGRSARSIEEILADCPGAPIAFDRDETELALRRRVDELETAIRRYVSAAEGLAQITDTRDDTQRKGIVREEWAAFDHLKSLINERSP